MSDFKGRKNNKKYSLGLKLKKIRQSKGLSLGEVSKVTKIRKLYLEGIERGDFSILPPKVYVRGFIKSYADFLKVDTEDALNIYNQELELIDSIKKNKKITKKKTLRDFFPVIIIGPKFFAGLIFSLVFIFGFSYFYREINQFARDPRLVIISPEKDSKIQDSRMIISGFTDKSSRVTINERELFVNNEGEFSQEMNLQEGFNYFTIKSQNKFGGVSQKELVIDSVVNDLDDLSPVVAGVDDNNYLELVLEAREVDIWVTVESDEEVVYDGVIRPLESKKFKAKKIFKLDTDKGFYTWTSFEGSDLAPISDQVEFKSYLFEIEESEIESFEESDLSLSDHSVEN